MSKTTATKFVIATAVSMSWLICSGCSSLTSQTIGLDSYEIPQGEFAMPAPGVDVNGQMQYGPQAPPAELSKVSLPAYRVEPPDILIIEGVKIIPKATSEIQPQDALQILVFGTTPERPIAGPYLVESDGTVNLGPGYGSVRLGGLTMSEAQDAIREKLLGELQQAEVSVTMYQRAQQQFLQGEHLVGPDGTVNLGTYGSVYVAGMTLDEARAAVEERLSNYFEDPRVSLDVFTYNSKFYYIIVEGGGAGDRVIRLPSTGNETVLDAISQVGGLDQVSSKKLWISRPTPSNTGCDQVLPVDWNAITRGASTATNYQLLPGDRLFIAENRIIALATMMQILTNPFERMFGFALLGGQTIQTLQRFPEGFNQRGF